MSEPDQTTHFGFRDVPLGDKQTLVNDVFHSVASRYDLMNDLMSGGLHRVWKDIMVGTLNPPKSERPYALLDVAGGTGDIAFRAAKASGDGFRATVCDINADMLKVGRDRAAKRHLDERVSFVEGNAEDLPFPDRSFDLVLSINTLHNLYLPGLFQALRELERVGRGGKFVVMDSYRNEREKVNLLYWQLTCECFFTPEEWAWLFQQAGYTGDYDFVCFE